MANIFNGFLDNLVNGALSPKGDMADYTHAARLYTDDNFRLAPKQKFLYHVTLNVNENVYYSISVIQGMIRCYVRFRYNSNVFLFLHFKMVLIYLYIHHYSTTY